MLIVVLYTAAALALALYGFNTLFLALFYLWRRPSDAPMPTPPQVWPHVTVQLPIYNEVHVATRVIRAAARLDYPPDRLEIQVLDDSDDETTAMVARQVRELRRLGVQVHHIRRPERQGYKAGALAYGLAHARGEFIAIFDADFVPPRDWLKRTVPHLLAEPSLGFVQTRWEHLNAWASSITLAQSLALDGHFAVEQPARAALGWPIAFNGSAGIWRRACIEASGNWQADTVCEDLDLSYRAQLAGWRGRVLTDTAVPGEIPPLVAAFRRQQARWATGSVQTLRKHARALLRASHLSWPARLEGLIHLSNYFVHPLMVLLFLLTIVLIWTERTVYWPLTYLSLASLGPPLAYTLAQWRLRGNLRRLRALPLLVFLGLGIAWHSTRAVVRGLRANHTPFERTPKFRLVGRANRWQGKRYGEGLRSIPLAELVLSLAALITAGVAWSRGSVHAVPFLLLYAVSFGTVAVGMLWEMWRQRHAPRPSLPAGAPSSRPIGNLREVPR